MLWKFWKDEPVFAMKDFILPQILFLPEELMRMETFIQDAKGEISGVGLVVRRGNDFLVERVVLLEQTCTTGSTNLNQKDILKYVRQLMQEKRMGDLAKIKLWWHSHHTMAPFWSGTDEGTIRSVQHGGSWLISIVGNVRGEYKTRFDLFEPIRLQIEGLPMNVYYAPNSKVVREARKELQAKVKQHSYGGYGYGYGAGEGAWDPANKLPAVFCVRGKHGIRLAQEKVAAPPPGTLFDVEGKPIASPVGPVEQPPATDLEAGSAVCSTGQLPPENTVPAPTEKFLEQGEEALGPGVTHRVIFLKKT